MAKQIVFSMTAAALGGASAFTPQIPLARRHNSILSSAKTPPPPPPNPTSLQMCICIHCARVTNCSAYYFVEEQHSQPHINKNPTWEPRNGSPTIQVHIRPDARNELEEMWGEHEEQTRQAEEANGGEGGDFPLVGEKQYDLSGTTSYEYDVVECEDFTEDKDAWVRHMPEEIRLANPNFVPT